MSRSRLEDRHGWAALIAGASILVRQTDVVWLVMIPILALVAGRPGPVSARFRAWAGYALGLAAFAVFVRWNGGVALGDRGSHPAFTIHLANVFFFLALYALFLLPGVLARLPRTLAFVRDRPAAVVALAAVLALYLLASDTDHPYNNFNFAPGYFLRNGILMAVRASLVLKVIGLVPIGLATVDVLAGAVRRRTLAAVATFTVLALVPSWLVEQRYDIIPFALWLAVAPEESARVEAITSVAYVTTALVFVYGIQNSLLFL